MGFMTRLATLMKADAHGMVDALEDKALMLRQHVREAGAELARKRGMLEAFDAEEKGLGVEAGTIGQTMQKLDDDVALAMTEGQEELARFAIKKLLPLRRRKASIERRLEALRRERSDLAEEVTRQEADLAELESRARAYLARLGRPEALRDDPDGGWWEPVADEEVELELLRRRKAAGEKGGS